MKLYAIVPQDEVSQEMVTLGGAFSRENLRTSSHGLCIVEIDVDSWEKIPKELRAYKMLHEPDIRKVLQEDSAWSEPVDSKGFFEKLFS